MVALSLDIYSDSFDHGKGKHR